MKGMILSAVLLISLILASPGLAAGPSEQNIREAYKMILSESDTNRDGKLSLAECKANYTDQSVAEKNCTFWDVDGDGIITESEYVKKAASLGKKK